MKIHVQRVDFGPELRDLEAEWDALLMSSSWPSIYSSFEYVYRSGLNFRNNEELFYLIFRNESSHELIAVFPLSLWLEENDGFILRVLCHATTTSFSEVDKPYPIIRRDSETLCWERFSDYFKNEYRQWDIMDFDTHIPESNLTHDLRNLFRMPRYCAKVRKGPESPIVYLDDSWENFWRKHRLVRRKTHRIEQEIGDNLSYVVTSDPGDMEQCLRQHVSTELRSWKAGQGVSEVKTQRFYHDILPRLAAKNQVYFSMMYDGEIVMSSVFAYTFMDRVYFAQVTYNPDYAELSPGIVNLSKLIQYFMGKDYTTGDFLCGAAHYAYPWAGHIAKTVDITIHRMGYKNCILALRYYGRMAALKGRRRCRRLLLHRRAGGVKSMREVVK